MLKSRRFWLSILVSVGFLGLFFITVDFQLLFSALVNANYAYVVPGVGFYFIAVGFRTLRWRYLLRPMKELSTPRLYPVVVVGYMANNLLPMRLGELVRSYYLGQREGVSKSSGLATILIERVFDGLVLLFFLAVIALLLPIGGLIRGLGESSGVPWPILSVTLSLPFFAILGVLISLAYYPPIVERLVRLMIRPLPGKIGPKVKDVVELFVAGLRILRSPRNMLALFAMSVPVWLFEAMLFFMVGYSFNLDAAFGSLWQMAVAAVLVTAITNLGASLPSSPGGIGLFELFASGTLVLLPIAAIDPSVAGAYAITVHAGLIVPVVILGQIFLFFGNTSLLQLVRRGKDTREYGAPALSTERDELA